MFRIATAAPLLLAPIATFAQPAADAPLDWRTHEAMTLRNHVQITHDDQFLKAGEAYFSPDGEWIIFQAVPTPAFGNEPREHYSMFVGKLETNDAGRVTGLGQWHMVSRPAAATTCGFFHPTEPGRIIFGSTIVEPSGDETPGYQRGSSRYRWAFPREMEIVTCIVPAMLHDMNGGGIGLQAQRRESTPRPLFERPGGYDAECGFSPDGRNIVFASVDPDTGDADLFIYDTKTEKVLPLITEGGYDGGSFFSPDGSMICYRSDREGNNLLQVYVAELEYDDTGAVTGVVDERAVTANQHVNWAPFFHPSGEFLVYATSEVSHSNYEVFAVEVPRGDRADAGPGELRHRRITHATGFDGLPVFSDDGRRMMWTSQRGPAVDGAQKGMSQLWIADVIDTSP